MTESKGQKVRRSFTLAMNEVEAACEAAQNAEGAVGRETVRRRFAPARAEALARAAAEDQRRLAAYRAMVRWRCTLNAYINELWGPTRESEVAEARRRKNPAG